MSAVVLAWTPPAPSSLPEEGDRWWHFAACEGVDTDLFAYRRKTTGKTKAAKAICASCPVREACLADAVKAADQHMILGGMTPPERRRAFAPGRRCRSLLHVLTAENTGERGRCLACHREKERERKRKKAARVPAPDRRGSKGERDRKGRFTSRQAAA